MDIKFDVEAIMADPTLNNLTWEVIEARGIKAGDLVTLWETALDMGRSCADCHMQALRWITPDEYGEVDPVFMSISQTYGMVSKFMAREAREIVKFLNMRKFEFPEGYTGKRPPDAWGA